MQKREFINLMLDIDNKIVIDFNGVITQNSIVDIAKTIEATLIDFGETESKIRNVFSIILEIMQNILNYSYNTVRLDNNTSQSNGSIRITHNHDTKTYTIDSKNIICANKKDAIIHLIDEVNSLDQDGLKELYKQRRRSRSNKHQYGAGLGFLDMARKSKNKIEFQFSKNDKDSFIFNLQVKI